MVILKVCRNPIGGFDFLHRKVNFFSVQSSVPMRDSLYTWTPIIGSGSNCQNTCPRLGTENPCCGREVCLQVSLALYRDWKSKTNTQHPKPCGHSLSWSSQQSVFDVHFMISPTHCANVVHNDLPIITVKTLAPAVPAAMTVHVVIGTAVY